MSTSSIPSTPRREARASIASQESTSSTSSTSIECPLYLTGTVSEENRVDLWRACLHISKRNRIGEQVGMKAKGELKFGSRLIVEFADRIGENLGASEFEKISYKSEAIRILSYFSAETKKDFDVKYGWHNVLEPLMLLAISEALRYRMFYEIQMKYVPRLEDSNEYTAILRLLIIYHEPKLHTFLESKDIQLQHYPFVWINRLFSGFCSIPVLLAIWDRYFVTKDRFMIFYLAAALMIKNRQKIFDAGGEDRNTILAIIWTLPDDLQVEDIHEFYEDANDLKSKTPKSFHEVLRPVIFGERYDSSLFNTTCWVVLAKEITKALSPVSEMDRISNNIRFYFIDVRSTKEYAAGHLPTAIHIDYDWKTASPIKFDERLSMIAEKQRRLLNVQLNHNVKHYCIIDNGYSDNKFSKILIKYLIQRHVKYICKFDGGYRKLHWLLQDKLDDELEGHNPRLCLECSKIEPESKFRQGFNKMIKEGVTLVQGMKSSKSSYELDATKETFISRMVKSQSMFGPPVVSITKWLQNPNILEHFDCEIEIDTKYHRCYLIITKTDIIALQEISGREDAAFEVLRRDIGNILRISTVKKQMNMLKLVFDYGIERTETLVNPDLLDSFIFRFTYDVRGVAGYIGDRVRDRVKFSA